MILPARLWRFAGVALLVVFAIYAWGNRTGRYQMVRLHDGVYVVLDTTNRRQYIYRGSVEHGRLVYELESVNAQGELLWRLLPPRAEDWVRE